MTDKKEKGCPRQRKQPTKKYAPFTLMPLAENVKVEREGGSDDERN